jgi:hypothetical protein
VVMILVDVKWGIKIGRYLLGVWYWSFGIWSTYEMNIEREFLLENRNVAFLESPAVNRRVVLVYLVDIKICLCLGRGGCVITHDKA